MREDDKFPSISEQGKNIIKTVFDVVSQPTDMFAPEEKQVERMSVCKECEYYSKRQNRCKQCGCFLTVKVKFNSATCPVGKW